MANRPRRAKTYISNLRCSQAQRKNPTTLNRRNMTIAISRQVSEFKSDTIQTTSENCALPTKGLFFNYFCNSSKLSSALSASPLTLAMLETENRHITQKESCILLAFGIPRRALFTTKKKRKKIAQLKPGPERHVPY